MTYRGSTLNLVIILLSWMLIVGCLCGLIFLGWQEGGAGSRPRRTRPPVVQQP